ARLSCLSSVLLYPSLGPHLHLHSFPTRRSSDLSEKAAIINSYTRFFRLTLQSLVLGVGALLVLEGRITAGMMIAGSILLGRALAPVEQLINVWKQWSGVRSSHERLTKLLEANPSREAGMALPAPKGNVSVEAATA